MESRTLASEENGNLIYEGIADLRKLEKEKNIFPQVEAERTQLLFRRSLNFMNMNDDTAFSSEVHVQLNITDTRLLALLFSFLTLLIKAGLRDFPYLFICGV